MLVTKTVRITWHANTRNHFESLGYVFTNYKDEFDVDVNDLTKGSKFEIECLCDYCFEDGKETIIKKMYSTYLKQNKESNIQKDCCSECRPKKLKESNLKTYGVVSTSSLDSVKQKVKETNLEKFGVEYFTQTKEWEDKYRETCLEKYGVDWYTKTNEYKDKATKTNLENLGFEYPTQSPVVRQKIVDTVQDKYGKNYTNVIQVPSIKEKSRTNANKTMFANNSQTSSRQQRFIHNILGGQINYLYDKIWLDIAFPDEKVYLEYQGSGHKLDIKLGKLKESEFVRKEIARYNFLKSKGWKMIEIISENDFVIENGELIKLFNYCRNKLNNGFNWIKINLDTKEVLTKVGIADYILNGIYKLSRNAII